MRLKLTLQRGGSPQPEDLLIDVDSTVSVGQLAADLVGRDPERRSTAPLGPVTIRIDEGPGARSLPVSVALADAGLQSGQTISVVGEAQAATTTTGTVEVAAVLKVIAGVNAGREFPLRFGSNTVGRDRNNDIVLGDPLISRSHVRFNISDVAEAIDLGSANGIIVDGVQTDRAILDPTTEIEIGETRMTVLLRNPSEGSSANSPVTRFNRSPRIDPDFTGATLTPPTPPDPAGRNRIPLIAALAPLVLGAGMFALTGRIESVLFIAMSPVMLVGNVIESRVFGKRQFATLSQTFADDLEAFGVTAREALADEVIGRCAEHPSIAETVAAVTERSPLLWSRRPDGQRFLRCRIGLGNLPTRVQFEIPDGRGKPPELMEQLTSVVSVFRLVQNVPVVADLKEVGAIGVSGARRAAIPVATSLVAQLAALHSPSELVIAAVIPASSCADWEWLKWLPHVDSDTSPVHTDGLAASTGAVNRLIGELEQIRAQRRTITSARSGLYPHVPAVLVIVEDDAPMDRPTLVDLVEHGASAGIHVLWVSRHRSLLPAGCHAFVDCGETGEEVTVGFTNTATLVDHVLPDRLSAENLTSTARSMSPIVDAGAKGRNDSALPRSVSGLRVLALPANGQSQAISERWTESITGRSVSSGSDSQRGGHLRAVVGVADGDPFVLDLRSQGPHALVGGTTGAGKSEFLQSWVMALAAAHSPARVTFLFIDYKGGAAFSECVKLPHSVGLVTDLSPHLVRRALVSLNAELQHREHVLRQKDAKDIFELERRGDPDTPPALVIVIDEFAALVQEVPTFVDGVVNVAQRGRSLGLHLILATQRPAGVIKDNLRANTNLRIALRMADETDSVDVVETKEAAYFDGAIPGRAIAKIGPGRLKLFQSGYFGGWTSDVTPPPTILIAPLRIGAGAAWPSRAAGTTANDDGPNDLARLVAATAQASDMAGIPAPRKPWLNELAAVYDLARLQLPRTDADLVFGVYDDPTHQRQALISFRPDTDGNMLVFGTSGAGKSTLLRTLALVAGITLRGGPCHVYCLDFGTRSLKMLEDMPHVGAVIQGDDHERVVRLLRELRQIIDERQERYRNSQAESIVEYRKRSGNATEPRILLLVDNVGAFRQAYEPSDRAAWFDMFQSIAAEGRSVGVHVVVTADRPGGVSTALASVIPRRLVLRLAGDGDYAFLGVPTDGFSAQSPPGRGFTDEGEFQVAVLGGSANVARQAVAAKALADDPRLSSENQHAPEIRRLPELVRLAELPIMVGDLPALGISDETLAPIGFRPNRSLLVAGPPGSGRSTVLATLALSLHRARPEVQCVLFAQKRSPLRTLLPWTAWGDEPSDIDAIAISMLRDLQTRDTDLGDVAIFVEGLADLLDTSAEANVLALLKLCVGNGALVVAESETAVLGRLWKVEFMKSHRHGIVLQPQTADGDAVLKTPFPRIGRNEFPPGRGIYVAGRSQTKVQCAVPETDVAG